MNGGKKRSMEDRLLDNGKMKKKWMDDGKMDEKKLLDILKKRRLYGRMDGWMDGWMED